MQRLVLLATLFVTCAAPPAATSPTPSATPTASASAVASPPSGPPATGATPTPTPIPLPTFAQLSAPGGTVVWALVGGTRLFRSTDRGEQWEERSLPRIEGARPYEMSFASEREGWIVAPGTPGTRCESQSVQLWRTNDAGGTWTSLASTGIEDPRCKGSLSFVDARRGFLSAWDQERAPVIYRTPDGGANWSASSPLPDPPGFRSDDRTTIVQPGAVRAFGTTLLVPAIGNTVSATTLFAFRSDDGGATWTYAAAAHLPSSLGLVTASRWIQLTLPEDSWETTDAGQTWHRFTTDYQQAAPVAPAVVFGDDRVGYATVRGGIQRTVDGGAHWGYLLTPGTVAP